jgi:hypothetical protein
MDEVSSHVCLVLPSTDGKAARKIVPPRPRIPYWKGLGADSEEKHEPASDIDTVVVDSLKALDPKRPIREADMARYSRRVSKVPRTGMALYSITSSARESRVGEMLRPSALAVLRLMASSILVGCSTGRSPGFAPAKILFTKNCALLITFLPSMP